MLGRGHTAHGGSYWLMSASPRYDSNIPAVGPVGSRLEGAGPPGPACCPADSTGIGNPGCVGPNDSSVPTPVEVHLPHPLFPGQRYGQRGALGARSDQGLDYRDGPFAEP